MSHVKPDSGSLLSDGTKFPDMSENDFLSHVNSFGSRASPKEESQLFSAASEPSRLLDPRLDISKKSMSSVSALKEYVSPMSLDHFPYSFPFPSVLAVVTYEVRLIVCTIVQ